MLELLAGILAISVLTAVLALLIEIAGRTIADYGEKTIRVNSEKKLSVEGGKPLLLALADCRLYLPSACGGKGTCGYCKVKVSSGGGPLLPTETPFLNRKELETGIRISCQVKVKQDMAIEVPEELLSVKEYRVRLDAMADATPDIKYLRFSVLEPAEGLVFKAGQYLQVEVPLEGASGSREFRAYSIASSPAEHKNVELTVTRVPDGTVSVFVHDRLKQGDELSMRGPFGDFYLRDSDRDILLIATGSGLAPIRAILYELERRREEKSVSFFFGDRRPFDLLFRDEMESFEKKLPRFRYLPTLSRPAPEDGWTGETGRVTDLIRRQVEEGANIDVYICGAPGMVQACCDLLTGEKKIPAEQIFFDKFE